MLFAQELEPESLSRALLLSHSGARTLYICICIEIIQICRYHIKLHTHTHATQKHTPPQPHTNHTPAYTPESGEVCMYVPTHTRINIHAYTLTAAHV